MLPEMPEKAQDVGADIASSESISDSTSDAPDALPPAVRATTRKFLESDAGDGSRREDHYLRGIKLFLCLLSLYVSLFLMALDQTIIVTLLSEVGNKFHSLDNIGWLLSGFLLSMAVLVATWGTLLIVFGRKYAMYAAIVIFEAGSLMCALANNMNVLIGGRVLAGCGGGGINSLVFIILTEVVPIERRPLAMAMLGAVFACASVLGPLVGGAFTSHVLWRWCFYINLPIGAVAAAFLTFAFNPPKPQGSGRAKLAKIDYLGTFLLVVGLVLFLLALTFGLLQYAWDLAAVIALFVIGIIFIILFGVWNFRFLANQTFPTAVVRVPQVMASAVCIFAVFGYFIAALLYLLIYFQVVWGSDAWHLGIQLLPMIIPVVVALMSTGILIGKTRYVKPFGIVGGVLGPIGCGLLCLLLATSSQSHRIGLLIVVGASCGLQMQLCLMSSQIAAPKTPGGTIMATTVVSFGRAFGGAFGSIMADTVYNTAFKHIYKLALANLTNESIAAELADIDVAQITSSSTVLDRLSEGTRMFVKDQIVLALHNVFYMCIGFLALALIANLFLTNKRLPKLSQGVSSSEAAEKATDDSVEETDKAVQKD